MQRKCLHYINPALNRQIQGLIDQLLDGSLMIKPDEIPYKLKEILPIEKLRKETIHRRVEGYFLASNLLFDKLMSNCMNDRKQIVSQARLKSMRYYHYVTGSREPATYMETRDDILNDPAAALVKLSSDIVGMANLLSEKEESVSDFIDVNNHPVENSNRIRNSLL